jgi:hypothetical protein
MILLRILYKNDIIFLLSGLKENIKSFKIKCRIILIHNNSEMM